VRPAQAAGALPVVLVVHENRGLNPHIEDIARRLAAGQLHRRRARRLFTTAGGYPGDEDKAREAFAKIDQAKAREDWLAAAAWTRAVAGGNGKLGATGFCFGGGIVNFLATQRARAGVRRALLRRRRAGSRRAAGIKAELLHRVRRERRAHQRHAGRPTRPRSRPQAPGTRRRCSPGTQHGFNNDTTPRFDEKQAQQAWSRTLALFNRTLRA
jgi:carboxymethylenebutenolidase